MLKIILVSIFLSLSISAHKLELPTAEAVVFLLHAQDIPKTSNYFYEYDFIIPYNKVKIYIKLKDHGVENFNERRNLANNILLAFKKIKRENNLKQVSGRVIYESDE